MARQSEWAMKTMITAIATTLATVLMVAACAPEIATAISHVGGEKHISVSASGPWPFHNYKDVREAAARAIRAECPQALPQRDRELLKNFGTTDKLMTKALEELRETLPVHSYRWSGPCWPPKRSAVGGSR